jgi:DNA-binding transcriptional LysR family regulator
VLSRLGSSTIANCIRRWANPQVQIELVTGTTGAPLEQVSRYAIVAAFVAERFESDGLENDRDCLWRGLLLPANSGGIAGSFKDHSRACFGIWILSRDRSLLRCGSGIAVIPHSVIHALRAESEVSILPLPTQFAEAATFLVWPREHRSAALDALRRELGQENAG